MAGAMTVLIMAFLMGASSFGFGMLPLTVQFSKTRLAQLSAFGIGLLLGAGLGVVIPEGVESVTPHNGPLPTHTIALSLIGGFAAMMLIEQLLPGHAHVGASAHEASNKSSSGHNRRFSVAASTASDNELDLDHEIELLESSGGGLNARDSQAAAASRARALPLSMGLVIHCAADGLALGASAIPMAGSSQAEAAALPLIVFLALVIHKAPTALALSTSLLATGLPKVAVRKHLIVFSLSSPLSAICTYYALSFLGGSGGSWTGIALLVSGGSFLYVATVLQPISSHGAHGTPATADELSKAMRLLLVVAGMLTPIIVTALVGHDEGHHANGPPANWPTPPDGGVTPSAS